MMEVLVLSQGYIPIRRVSWRKAFCYVFSGKAEVVAHYNDCNVHSSNQSWQVPSVVRLIRNVPQLFRQVVKFNRKNVYLRDQGRCQYCEQDMSLGNFTIDHVVPRAAGGRSKWDNVVTCCRKCNQRKGHKSPIQAGMRLKARPRRPRSLPGLNRIMNWQVGMPDSWRDYLRLPKK